MVLLPPLSNELPAGLLALPGVEHSHGLVLLSYLIASAAAFTALTLAHTVGRARALRDLLLWRGIGGIALGGGIWAMHFVAMLALRTPVPIDYAPGFTTLSLLIAVVAAYLLMGLLGRPALSPGQYLGGAILSGFGITGMHYVGMAALQSPAQACYQPLGVALSLLVAIGASLAALVVAQWEKTRPGPSGLRLLYSLVMGAAIVSMHFTGMHAMTLALPPEQLSQLAGQSPAHGGHLALGVSIGLVALVIIAAGVVGDWAEQRFREQRDRLDSVARELDSRSHYDPLTRLLNGEAFTRLATQRLAGQPAHGLALLSIDLDNFKRINDSLGRRCGDEVLQQVARRLQRLFGSGDLLARFAGDEFSALIEVDGMAQAQQLCRRILDQLLPPLSAGDTQLRLTASIGISLYPEDGSTLDALLTHAGLAVGECKAGGRNGFLRFDPRQEVLAQENLSLEQDLRRALAHNRLEVHYQPIVDCRSGTVLSLEALVRWRHPQLGPISPERFVRIAEQHGFITELDAWVTRRACLDLRLLQQAGFPALRVAVNASALDLCNPQLPQALSQILQAAGVEPQCLTLEITENALMHNLGLAIEVLESIRQLGVKVSIDDFGTGYSSLAYLSRLPVDTLKVDRSFVRELESQPNDRAITTAIIAMAHRLGLKVIAEGVEHEAQRRFLQAHDCDMIQGYLYSRPLDSKALFQWLQAPRMAGEPA